MCLKLTPSTLGCNYDELTSAWFIGSGTICCKHGTTFKYKFTQKFKMESLSKHPHADGESGGCFIIHKIFLDVLQRSADVLVQLLILKAENQSKC